MTNLTLKQNDKICKLRRNQVTCPNLSKVQETEPRNFHQNTYSVKENLKYFISFNFSQSTRNDLSAFCQVPPITAFLGSFGFAQRVSQDFPECILNGHSVKDILGKNILQFGFVLSELMKNCRDSNEFEEVIVTLRSEQIDYWH